MKIMFLIENKISIITKHSTSGQILLHLCQFFVYISIGQNDRGKHREHEKEQHFFLMSRNEAVNENMMCRVKPFDIF